MTKAGKQDPVLDKIEEAATEFETSRQAFEMLQGVEEPEGLQNRIKHRTLIGMAEVRFRVASKRLNQAVQEASEAA